MPENWYEFSYLQAIPPAGGTSGDAGHWGIPNAPLRGGVSAGKTTYAYTAHSYPTKVPPEAIEPLIEHYTAPGALVLDPFCGSGMTGLAARRTGRRAVLNDLSSLAVHLAYNHSTGCSPEGLSRAWHEIRTSLEGDISQIYGIACAGCTGKATIRYTIWSDVYECPGCGVDLPLWKHGLDRERGTVRRDFSCPDCGHLWRKTAAVRKRAEPAWVTYTCSCARGVQERSFTDDERSHHGQFKPINDEKLFAPSTAVGRDREMYRRSALHLQGIQTVRDFYTTRNLAALQLLWDRIGRVSDERIRMALAFAFTNTAWHGTRMRRFNARGGHRPLTGTLYIPQISAEANVFDVFDHKIKQLVRFFSELGPNLQSTVSVHRGSATDLSWLGDESVDYIFTDPPFGSNIFYADCNLIGEAWLGDATDTTFEAVVNRSLATADGGKDLRDYQALLEAAFAEMHRVLKPGAWATVVFQSSDGEVWRTIEEAAALAGFEMHEASVLDKVQQSMKGYKGRNGSENVASFDIVLNLRKWQTADYRALRQISTNQLEIEVLRLVRARLAATESLEGRNRTLPFLYSAVVQGLLNNGYSVGGLTMERLRSIMETALDEEDGRWFLRAEATAA
jgi:DNA modification methylase/predicted RNA-binding Zn-ribbon protein involved in translation (DUF1610 family)